MLQTLTPSRRGEGVAHPQPSPDTAQNTCPFFQRRVSPAAETKVINMSHSSCPTARALHILYELRTLCVSMSAADRRAARIYTLPYCTTCSIPLICASLHFALHFEGSFRHRAAVSVFYTLVTYSAVSALVDIYKAAAPAFPAVKWKSAVCC